MREKTCSECRWVAVVDGSGRRRFEMRWHLPAASASVPRAA